MTGRSQGPDARSTVLALVDAMSCSELETCTQLLHPDATMEFPFAVGELPRRVDGRSAIVAMISKVPVEFAEFAFEPTATFAADDGLAVVLEMRGYARRHDGVEYNNHYVVVAEAADGRVSSWREYYNPFILLASYESDAEFRNRWMS